MLDIGSRYWMLDAGYWMLVTGYWLLDAGRMTDIILPQRHNGHKEKEVPKVN